MANTKLYVNEIIDCDYIVKAAFSRAISDIRSADVAIIKIANSSSGNSFTKLHLRIQVFMNISYANMIFICTICICYSLVKI